MPDSVTVLVVPGLSAWERTCAELEACLPEWMPLGPSFPVLEQVVLGTLFSGQEGPGLELWTRGHSSRNETGTEQPLWLWDHLARHRPHLPSACWLLPLPGQGAALGARPAGGDEVGPWDIWPPEVRDAVQRACGPGPRSFPLEAKAPQELPAALEELLRWCLASAAVAFRHAEAALGIVYVPVVLAGAYLWGLHSRQGAALARRCAVEVLEFAERLRSEAEGGGEHTLLLVDPWGLQEVEQVVDLEPVRLHLGQLAEQLAPGREEPTAVFTLQVEHQVARLTWSRQLPLAAERLREQLAALVPQAEVVTASQCGLVTPGGGSSQEATAQLWLLAPRNAVFVCSCPAQSLDKELPQKVRLVHWGLPEWLKRWGIASSPELGLGICRATHGRVPQAEEQQGRLWTGEPGLLFGPVLSDLDLAGLVLAHWGV